MAVQRLILLLYYSIVYTVGFTNIVLAFSSRFSYLYAIFLCIQWNFQVFRRITYECTGGSLGEVDGQEASDISGGKDEIFLYLYINGYMN